MKFWAERSRAERRWYFLTGPEQEYMLLIAQQFELTVPDEVMLHLDDCDCCSAALSRIAAGGTAIPPPVGRAQL